MTKKRPKKLSFEKTMKMAALPRLSDHEVLSAKKRVWNSLASEISSHDKSLENEKSSNYKLQSSIETKPWFLQYKTYAYSMAFLSICLIVVTGSFTFYSQYLQTQNPGQTTSSRINYEQVKDVQALAASKFAELNGVTFEEFKAALVEEKPNVETPINEPTPTNIIKIDSSKGENLLTSIATKDISTFITDKKLEITDKELFAKSDIYLDTYMNTDSKEFSISTTTRPNYFKQVIRDSDSIVYLNNQNPSTTVTYKGGVYAIKQVYIENQIQIAGLGNDGALVFNPETKVLQEILTNPDAELTETLAGDYITTIQNKNQNSKFVYTLEKNSLSIKKQEYWIEGQLVYTLTTLNKKEIKAGQNSINSDFSLSELENKKIEIKEIKSNPDFSKFSSVDFVESSFKDYSNKYTTFAFSSNTSSAEDSKLYDFTSEKNREYFDYVILTANKDFDPNFTSRAEFTFDKDLLAIQKTSNLEIKVYPKSFPLTSLQNGEKIEILIDNEKAEAFWKTENTKRNLSFTYKNHYFVFAQEVKENENPALLLAKDLKLTTLTVEKAASIDAITKAKADAKPVLKELKLDSSPSTSSGLAGLTKENSDFAKKYASNKKVEIKNIYTFEKTSKQSVCEKYYLENFNEDYLNCVLEKNDGFILNTKSTTNSSTSTIYYISKDSVEKKYLDVLEKNNFKVEKSEGYLILLMI